MAASRTPIIAGNWKMHHNHLTAIQVVQKLSYLLDASDHRTCEVVVCPPLTALRSVQTTIDSDRMEIQLGAQHCHWELEGALTGEVSPSMLAKLNVRYVIAGHSERRQIFAEPDEWVNKKVRAILAQGMSAILCCGETIEQREAGETQAWITGQVTAGLQGVTEEQMAKVVVAYEPIWAIGTGRTATAADADEACGWIRAELAARFGDDVAGATRIQYGGSVKSANIAELMGMRHVDGALVGGASLDPDEFARIVRYRG
jgi:triosephosphate isomerase (TIM)